MSLIGSMSQKVSFEDWMAALKRTAVSDFNYTELEAADFNPSDWRMLYESDFSVEEALSEEAKALELLAG